MYENAKAYLPRRWNDPNELSKRLAEGDLVLYNGACNGGIMTAFMDELVIGTILLLDRLGLELVDEDEKLKLDYFATLSAPKAKIGVKIETKKEK